MRSFPIMRKITLPCLVTKTEKHFCDSFIQFESHTRVHTHMQSILWFTSQMRMAGLKPFTQVSHVDGRLLNTWYTSDCFAQDRNGANRM